MSITPLPAAPAVTDTTSEFNTKAFNWVAALDPFTTEANALLATCEDAATTASAALAVVGAEAWVSGTTYAIGDPVYSPIDLQTYRRKTNGAGTTDPSADTTNWEKVALDAPLATQIEMEAGTESSNRSVSPLLVKQAISALGYKEKTWTAITATGTYTVPTGITSIRAYAFGAGANGVSLTSGGGGGCAYGDIAVTAGQIVNVTISAGVATVSYASVTRLTANAASGITGGTATKAGSVTNGGAYTGGWGNSGTSYGSGGGASGSPLGIGGAGGVGSSTGPGGGGGAGGVGGSGRGGGGGAGGAGSAGVGSGAGGGAGGAATGGRGGVGRYVNNLFTDPILEDCVSPGGNSFSDGGSAANISGINGGPGGGGGFAQIASGTTYGGNGGAFGGGGANFNSIGGNGGFGGGGGGGGATGGTGGFGGGGGGGTTPGSGGAAIVLIYA